MKNTYYLTALAAVTLYLTACGGGGDDGGPTASTLAFPVGAGAKADVLASQTTNYTVSGSCSGTARVAKAAPTNAVFEGKQAASSTATLTVSLTNCSPSNMTQNQVNYYDATHYGLLGVTVPGSSYDVVVGPVPFPATVKVGDSGTLWTLNNYSSSSKTTSTGKTVITYAVDADTTTTATLSTTFTTTNASGQVTGSQIAKTRIAQDGSMAPITLDTTVGSTRLLATKV